MRICHIADVHWRGLTRHAEYKKTFEDLANDLRSKNVDVIFIGGDIFHTKTSGISPEYIDVMAWWFDTLASIAPVHIILGNHDGNLVNLTRQDAISPIITALKSDQISLYKKSGVFPIGPGVNLCVLSIFDLEGWKDVKPVKGEINVACFHGPLKGSKSEEGWEFDSDLGVEDFRSYDFVLLGDIHAQQFLDYRPCKDGTTKPWIGYPGSTIQQNYGETIDGHGYLLWDIKAVDDFDVEFIKLPNHHPFVTIDWDDNIKKTCQKYPSQSRFRIRSPSHIPQKEARAITAWLLNRGALEVVFKTEQEKSKILLAEESQRLIQDVRNVDALLGYMKKYSEFVSYSLSKEDWADIEKIVRDVIKTIVDDNEIARHTKWSLKSMEWDNLYAYGENNSIDFAKLNGIIGVLGPNRSGKSSIVGTMAYGLFNTTDRGSAENLRVVNERKPYGLVKMDVISNIGDYYLERQTVKKENRKGSISAPTTLNFYSRAGSNKDLEEMNGEQRKDTEKVIRKLLGTFDDFQLTGLSRQGDLNRFINEGSTQRKAILTKFLDLDYLERLHEMIKSDMNNLKYTSKGLYDNHELKIKNAKADLTNASTNLSEKEIKLEEVKSKIDDLKRTYADATDGSQPVTAEDLAAQELIVKKYTSDLKHREEDIKGLNDQLVILQEKREKIENLERDYDLEELKRQYREQLSMETELAQKKAKYEREHDLLIAKEKSVKKLLEVPCGDSFPTCKYIRDSHQDKLTIKEQKARAQEALDLLDSVKRALVSVKNQNLGDKITKLEKLKHALVTINIQINESESKKIRFEGEVQTLSSKLQESSDRLDDLKLSSASDVGLKYSKIKKDIESYQSQAVILEREVRGLYSEKGKFEHELQSLQKTREESEKTLGIIKIYEFVTQSLSKKGIPALILRSQLPIINEEVEKILQGTFEFSVEFELDDDLNSMDIVLNYGDSKRYIEMCSGMEKTIAAIAIRVALINITSLPKPDFLILDEGFGTLDPLQIEPCGRLLQSLKNYFRFVMVITHVDPLKDYIDDSIEVTRKEKDSYVSYT
jgi:DNA repair exonuclease SbcCD ATPase subunit/DNA repair exonuclease SbcCD nuclease subunit